MVKEKKYRKEFRNTIIWSILALAVSGFIAILPDSTPRIAIAYAILSFLSITMIANFDKIAKFSTYKKKRPLSEKLYGVTDKPFRRWFYGLFFGGLFVLVSSIKAFSILQLAIPVLPLSLTANSFIVLVVSWVVETIFFVMLLSILGLFMGFLTAVIIRALLFAGFHYVAYVILSNSSITNVLGAFIGAFIFSFMAGFLAMKIGAEADGGAHFLINGWNWNQIFGFFTVIS